MNGRIYDPKLGRFLQADPIVQAPKNSQNLNRYSYVLNNPLSYTDPTGFSFWKKVRPFVSIAVMTVGMIYAPYLAPLWGGMSGFISSGNMKGAVIGAFSAAVFQGIGTGFARAAEKAGAAAQGWLRAGKILAHGIVGGVMSSLNGGKFGHGFWAAGFTQAFAGPIDGIDAGNAGFSAQRTVVAATVGGTASELSGGKFANGAVTGAFSRAFNDEIHHGKLADFLQNRKLREATALALAASGRNVRAKDNGNRTLGLAIFPDGEGGFNNGEYPNDIPNSWAARGRMVPQSSGRSSGPIEGAAALAIAVPLSWRDFTVLEAQSQFQDVSDFVGAPVIVSGLRAGQFFFNGYDNPVQFKFPRN